jgi:antitoxin component YwqK of YwqJK toxin-antitoxin module
MTKKLLLAFGVLVAPFLIKAQTKIIKKSNNLHNQKVLSSFTPISYALDENADTINLVDYKLHRQGKWIIINNSISGLPPSRLVGRYIDNNKQGTWFEYQGAELISSENYRNNVLDGESRYFENGNLVCKGNYRGLNAKYKYDSVIVHNPATNKDTLVILSTEEGTMKHGLWTYYDGETGVIIKQQEYYLNELFDLKEDYQIKMDSTLVQKRQAMMPHNSGRVFAPMQGKNLPKPTRYTDIPESGKGIKPNIRAKK